MYHPPIAQLVEQVPFKHLVVGSIPTGRTREKNPDRSGFFDTWPRRSHVFPAGKTDESWSGKFPSDGEEIILDDNN